MFNSTVLDVAVGLIFTFLALSLAVSAIVEAVASVMKWRSKTLLDGVKQLLNDDKLSGLALNIYNHGLVSPRDTGKASTAQGLTNLPSYIDPKQFADALLDVTKTAKDTPANIKAAINSNVADPQLKDLMNGIVDRTAGDLGKMRDELATWFDNGMDRVSGVYKRKAQLWSFVIALLAAGFLNVNSIEVGTALWKQPMLAKTIAVTENLEPLEALRRLEDLPLPIGWTQAKLASVVSAGFWSGLEKLAGWLITAFATLFGAPFWFDALQQIVRLKGSGPSPAEKRSGTGAAN
jgi:hypothetical protein